mmetsp:Transcript_18787/g.40429  ORF Transcript_18787/g.40429 Transcript_18787/m.40429 type:complete len:213 (-) Transcript_18787:522-1160(-)|eukprot:CAMPEP_0202902528 /NCGR_PEP_ID=MMETSP1392-20130828/16907_1 /ASSEMBLY_ACC=CAM_ASM_000868 /TAXON_ID=225041 /ORGANISM="Chlamydomonas chlamydogama, Strain SAG 11-48b" /LENGTH=212 /DNA_ID=CAMNT_0049589307 /DNA_START=149 /DNA_END=787 /DNA_ORIENTATION=-
MSNCEVFNLPLVEAEPHQLREVLRCIIHTILFNRALGFVKPKDVDSELFDITYVQVGDPEVELMVESKLTEFCSVAEKRPAELVQLCLSFYEKRRKQAWFGTKDERLYWEQWCINISVLQPDIPEQQFMSASHAQELSARVSRMEGCLEQLLSHIARCVNEKRDHIPPVVSSSIVTFPFEITFAGGSRSTFGSNVQAVKKMLMQTSPPPMLS